MGLQAKRAARNKQMSSSGDPDVSTPPASPVGALTGALAMSGYT